MINNIRSNTKYVDVNIKLDVMNDRITDAQKWLDAKVFQDTLPYIPYLDGEMTRQLVALNSSRVGSGEVVIGTGPYAQYLYDGKVMVESDGRHAFYIEGVGWRHHRGSTLIPTGEDLKYTTSVHPLAQKNWGEASVNANLQQWTEGVRRILNGE